PQQASENPSRADFGRFAGHFGKAHKVFFVTADSLSYDFARLAPLDFVFLDGGHDHEHVASDTRKAYRALAPGGWLVWHDWDSPVAWVQVRSAVEELGQAETVYHVAGTTVAFLRKEAALTPPPTPPRSGEGSRITLPLPASGRGPGGGGVPPLAVVWEGAVSSVQSLALVNRELCLRLAARGHDGSVLALAFTPPGPDGPSLAAH